MILRCALAACLWACIAGNVDAAPQRIVSLNLCGDELALRLAPPGTVKSVTWLARDPAFSNVAALARRIAVNRGLVEDVVPLAPDLVIAGAYTTRTAVALLRRLGIPVLELGVPSSVDEALTQITTVAGALGNPAAGVQLVEEIRSGFAAAPALVSSQPIAAVYQPNGFTIGKGSLINDLLSRAGLRNLAVEQRIENYGALSLEQLLFAQPDLLIMNTAEDRGPALAHQVLRHPALARRYSGARVLNVPSAWWSCPGPRLVDAARQLQQAAQRVSQLR